MIVLEFQDYYVAEPSEFKSPYYERESVPVPINLW